MAVDSISLPPKWLRWLATYHPDNRSRKLFLRQSNVKIGSGTVINTGFIVSDDYKPLLSIGERVAISPNVIIVCVSSPNNSNLKQVSGFSEKYLKEQPVTIGDDTWIGAGTIILPGITIGSMVVIGAGSIVTKNIPDSTVVAGCPASVINKLDLDR